MVEHEYLGVQSRLPECRAQCCLDEVSGHVPAHHHRHGVAGVERLILRGNCVYVKALGLHVLYPFHEVLRVVLIA